MRAGLAERFRRPPAKRIYRGSNPLPGSIHLTVTGQFYCSFNFETPRETVALYDEENRLILSEEQTKDDLIRMQAFLQLTTFEKKLRTFIKTQMERKYGKNWEEHGGDSILRAERKAKKENSPDVINYINFSDYWNIMNQNWSLFSKNYPKKRYIEVWLSELGEIRNRIMHSRDMDKTSFDTLNLYINKIGENIK